MTTTPQQSEDKIGPFTLVQIKSQDFFSPIKSHSKGSIIEMKEIFEKVCKDFGAELVEFNGEKGYRAENLGRNSKSFKKSIGAITRNFGAEATSLQALAVLHLR